MRNTFNMSAAEALKAMQVICRDLQSAVDATDENTLAGFLENRMAFYNSSMDFLISPSNQGVLREIAHVYALYGEGEIAIRDKQDPYLSVAGAGDPSARALIAFAVIDRTLWHMKTTLADKDRQNPQSAAKLLNHIQHVFDIFPYAQLAEVTIPDQNEDMLVYLGLIAQYGDSYTKTRAAILVEKVRNATIPAGEDCDINLEPALQRFENEPQ